MNFKLKTFLLITAMLLSFSLPAFSEVEIDDEGNYKVDVDKFVPSKGIKVKNSQLAEMMESGTRNAMHRNSGKNTESVNRHQQNNNSFMDNFKNSKKDRQYVTIGGYRIF